ncbi:MAG: hypothetical protein H6Q89_4709, partial [Myxococcaceae bacterium]|nr:hypothetical protein [Myxococcaceae bacterium]
MRRQLNQHLGAEPRFALQRQRPLVSADDRRNDRQPQTAAFSGG